MKKFILALAIMATIGSARAATLQWGVNMDSLLYVTEDGSSVTMANKYGEDTTGWKFCLVYLGTSSSLDIGSVSDSTVVQTFDYSVYDDGDAAYADTYQESFRTTGAATGLDGSDISISVGDYFGVVFYNGSEYSTILSVDSTGTIGSPVTDVVQLNNLSATANTVTHYVGGEGIAVSAVPEPSVAILGLLGLGMLIKRRKA